MQLSVSVLQASPLSVLGSLLAQFMYMRVLILFSLPLTKFAFARSFPSLSTLIPIYFIYLPLDILCRSVQVVMELVGLFFKYT